MSTSKRAACPGHRRPSADIGPEPAAPPADTTYARMRDELVPRGYRLLAEHRGPFAAGAALARSVSLDAGRCYAVIAAGDASVEGIELHVRGPDGRVVGRDATRRRDARVRFCTDVGGSWQVDATPTAGRGAGVLSTFVLEEPPAVPRGLDPMGRVAFAELSATLGARAMRPRPIAWAQLGAGQRLAIPIELPGGRCTALALVRSGELEGAGVDLLVTDEQGELVASDTGAEVPVVFRCPDAPARARLLVRVFGGSGRVLAVAGDEEGP
jgi:hypothetical protein